jgi:hypothetical protein
MPRYMRVPRACAVCEAHIRKFELISGVPLSKGGPKGVIQLLGHYLCVKQELGADRVLRAMELGLLPNIPHDQIINHKLRKYVEFEQQAGHQNLKVYEYIEG